MSYDLAVWEGARSASDAEAMTVFGTIMEQLEVGDPRVPSPAIAAYVQGLLDRWPDLTTDAGEDSPWADGPLIGNASGSWIYFSMVWSAAQEASAFAAQLAAERALVCFDPQLDALRP